jgi:hypothetical protein
MTPASFEALTQINLDDLVASFGWQDHPLAARILRRVFRGAAQKFAKQMLEFDAAIAQYGLAQASRLTQRQYACEVRVFGADLIPAGPFLALSNHPGMTDTLSLFITLNRPDLKIIALERPFLKALTNTSQQLFYVNDDAAQRMGLIRQVSAHLRSGGAALTFPAGQIEPDPDVKPGALESLDHWTDSAGIFLRLAPETAVLPMLVRGVIRQKSIRHPLLRIKKTTEEKERLAAALQLLAHIVFRQKDVRVRVQVGRPIYARELGSTETQVIHQAVLTEMKRLIENPPAEEGLHLLRAVNPA